MTEPVWKTFPCIPVTQPIGTFYVAAISAKDLRQMCWADIRKIELGERDVEVISGIQRPLNERRKKQIAKYVRTVDASFPTGVIIAVESDNASFDPEQRTIRLRIDDNVAKIIDGQHRLEGLQGFTDGTFELNTIIFVNMETQDQAMLFSVINLTQTKVSKSLVYDLYEYAESRSPQKTCHNIARVADTRSDSPFMGRIKLLGTAEDKAKELITQAGFVEPILSMISTDPLADLDHAKRAKLGLLGLRQRAIPLPSIEEVRAKNLVFRKMFLQDRDDEITKTIFNYFKAVSLKWPTAWDTIEPGLVLNRTTGYRALMGFLPFLIFRLGYDQVLTVDNFTRILSQVNLLDEEINTENFKPGSSGEAALRQRLMNATGITEGEAWKGTGNIART
jgi:DGQHR domain-containing protein